VKAAFGDDHGGAVIRDTPAPSGGARIRVHASGLNRADLLQAAGLYPPPPGESDVLGMECAGEDESGRRVCALLGSGGLAEEVAVDPRLLLEIPGHLSFAQAAAIPEVWLTAFLNLFIEGGLAPGERLLIHAGASGVGTAAIQLARRAGAYVIATSRSPDKLERCRALGAHEAMRDEDVHEPVDMILDVLGGGALARNLQRLRRGGRLVCIALMQGTAGELDMRRLLSHHLHLVGSTLRSRSNDDKAALTARFRREIMPAFARSELVPIIDSSFPFKQLSEAMAHLASNATFGKVVVCQ
jgi:putative PIG3 family NAD(P)H quinone oxidoreductase